MSELLFVFREIADPQDNFFDDFLFYNCGGWEWVMTLKDVYDVDIYENITFGTLNTVFVKNIEKIVLTLNPYPQYYDEVLQYFCKNKLKNNLKPIVSVNPDPFDGMEVEFKIKNYDIHG